MADIIMAIGTGTFLVLFAFLLFLFATFIASFFRKEVHNTPYTPPISVLIPAYNEEKSIEKCITALQNAIYPNTKEIIVIDDGSTDSTKSIAKKLGVRILTQHHEGKTDALNLGVKKAKHDIIVTIDADTYVTQECLVHLVQPFGDKRVALTSGAVRVQNKNSLLGLFQNIEYHYNNLIRKSFSQTYHTGIWFFGCLGAYRKSILDEVGGFSKDTVAEDMEISMACKAKGYKIINAYAAIGYTIVPESVIGIFNQRSRWWIGGLQSLNKHSSLLYKKTNPSLIFLFVNHYWWAVYAFLSTPLIAYQVYFWWPQASQEVFLYLFRWFSLWGPFYVLYKIPEWGINIYNIFGVMSGIISVAMIVSALYMYKDRLSWRNILAIFFYFPYTILLNMITAVTVIKAFTTQQKYFKK